MTSVTKAGCTGLRVEAAIEPIQWGRGHVGRTGRRVVVEPDRTSRLLDNKVRLNLSGHADVRPVNGPVPDRSDRRVNHTGGWRCRYGEVGRDRRVRYAVRSTPFTGARSIRPCPRVRGGHSPAKRCPGGPAHRPWPPGRRGHGRPRREPPGGTLFVRAGADVCGPLSRESTGARSAEGVDVVAVAVPTGAGHGVARAVVASTGVAGRVTRQARRRVRN